MTKTRKTIRFASALFILASVSCSFSEPKGANSAWSLASVSSSPLAFQTVTDALFRPTCYDCHASAIASGGVILDTYSGVTTALDRIWGEVDGATMPPAPRDGVSACQKAVLKKWIAAGAPETNAVPMGPIPECTNASR